MEENKNEMQKKLDAARPTCLSIQAIAEALYIPADSKVPVVS